MDALTERMQETVDSSFEDVDAVLLVVDARHDADRVTGLLLEELLRSARNKGCTVVEATPPADGSLPTAWERHGFRTADERIECRIAADRASAGKG